MGYIDNEKQREKICMINNFGSSLTNLGSAFNQLEMIIASFDRIATGLPSGNNDSVRSLLSSAKARIDCASKNIASSQQLARQLNTEIEDGDSGYGQFGNYY